MAQDLLSFGPLLSLSADDPVLIKAVEALGAKLRVRPSDQLGFFTVKKAGIEFRFQKESWLTDDPGPLKGPYVLTEVGVFADGQDGYKQFSGELIKTITFEATRKDVRKVLGKPINSGGGNSFGDIVFPEWDRFRVKRKYFIEFSYLPEDNRVCEASITLPGLAKE